MNKHSIYFSKLLQTVILGCLLSLTIGYTSTAEARQGCGTGWHNCYGHCVRNGTPGCNQRWYHGGCWIRGVHYDRCPH